MTTKMTRRTFLKGAAAAAAAVSLSGLLTGCGGDQLADNEVQIGPFIVKVYGLDVALGTASGNDKGAITGTVLLPPRRSADRIKNPLPRALWKECPGLFVVLPRGRRVGLGNFSGNVKKGATVFTASLQALGKGPAQPPKDLPAFCPAMVEEMLPEEYNRAVPKKNTNTT